MSSTTTDDITPDTKFVSSMKSSIITVSVMILVSSILSYITIISKSMTNTSFVSDPHLVPPNISQNDMKNNVVDTLQIITQTPSFWSRINIRNNILNPFKWISPSKIIEAYSIFITIEPIITKSNDINSPIYFNNIYRAILALPKLRSLYTYFTSPPYNTNIPDMEHDIKSIYMGNTSPARPPTSVKSDDIKYNWDTSISHYIAYYTYSVISETVNTNLFLYNIFISYFSKWNETYLFFIYSIFGTIIMYAMAIISTIVLFVTSISEIPKLFSDRRVVDTYSNTTQGDPPLTVEWSINSLQFINPFRLFVVYLFISGYAIAFLFVSLFTFVMTIFIPLSLTGSVSKYIQTYNDGCQFMFADRSITDGVEKLVPDKNKIQPTSCDGNPLYKPVTFRLQDTVTYFWYLRNFLYRNKNYILYISIIYTMINITISYNDSTHILSFLVCILVLWLLGMFGYRVDKKYTTEIYRANGIINY